MSEAETESMTALMLDCIERWNVYRRLQELSIQCDCAPGKSLEVRVHTPTDAIQVWGVVRQFTAPRQVTVAHLDRCWQQLVGKIAL